MHAVFQISIEICIIYIAFPNIGVLIVRKLALEKLADLQQKVSRVFQHIGGIVGTPYGNAIIGYLTHYSHRL